MKTPILKYDKLQDKNISTYNSSNFSTHTQVESYQIHLAIELRKQRYHFDLV